MKKFSKIFVSIFVLLISSLTIVSCNGGKTEKPGDGGGNTPTPPPTSDVDYVSQTKLNREFKGKSFLTDGIEEVKLLNSIDGDTIHVTDNSGTILQLRFSGVDTPESTGTVEPWGKAAAAFTRTKVEKTTSIVIESDKATGNESHETNGRYLTWVWYLDNDTNEYRLLNLELVQNGYSYGKYSSASKYQDVVKSANDQAVKQKIKVFGQKDPNYSTQRQEIDLKTLRESLTEKGQESKYLEGLISFEANVTRVYAQTAYVEDVDLETGNVYAIQVYMGYKNFDKIKVGNRVLFTGNIVFYEVGNTYQMTSIQDTGLGSYKDLKLVSENNEIKSTTITPSELVTENDNLIYNLVKIENAKVESVYVTQTEGSSNKGAMTLTCVADGITFTIRTVVLVVRENKNEDIIVDSNNIVLKETFEGKTITVEGIVELYEGAYQVKLVSMNDVTFIK